MNSNDAYINGTPLLSIGVHMGDSFLDALLAPAPLKEFTQCDARTRHGVRILTAAPRYSSRDVSLTFIVCGDTPEELTANRAALLNLFAGITIGVYVPAIMSDTETMWLVYTGKNVTLSTDIGRTVSKVTAKFIEPDPTNRTAAEWVADL